MANPWAIMADKLKEEKKAETSSKVKNEKETQRSIKTEKES